MWSPQSQNQLQHPMQEKLLALAKQRLAQLALHSDPLELLVLELLAQGLLAQKLLEQDSVQQQVPVQELPALQLLELTR